MDGAQIGGIIRAMVAAVGGYFVGKGIVDQATVEGVAGAISVLAVAVWSVWNKRKSA